MNKVWFAISCPSLLPRWSFLIVPFSCRSWFVRNPAKVFCSYWGKLWPSYLGWGYWVAYKPKDFRIYFKEGVLIVASVDPLLSPLAFLPVMGQISILSMLWKSVWFTIGNDIRWWVSHHFSLWRSFYHLMTGMGVAGSPAIMDTIRTALWSHEGRSSGSEAFGSCF